MSYTDWRCPECGKTARTPEAAPRSARMHQCPKLLGLIAPMVRVGTTARILLHEREAYVGKTHVQTTPERGRPVMSMETQYADGRNDLIVYAPLAVTKRR